MTRSTTRRHPGRLLATLLAAGLVLAGCGSDDPEPSSDTATEQPSDGSDTATDQPSDGDEAMSESDAMSEPDAMTEHESDAMTEEDAMTEGDGETDAAAPALDIDATMADGATITLADYAGQPVFVETFATWCSNCRAQLGDTQQAAAEAGGDAVFLALSVESDLDPARLDDYAAENGFADVTFAVLSDQSLATLAEQFGNGVLVPPSTPKFTVATDGAVSEMTTGFESVEEILGQLDAIA